MIFTKNYPSPVNRELFRQELSGFEVVASSDYFQVLNALAEDETTIDAIIAAHDGTQQTTEQQNEATSALTKAQVRDYLRTQLVNPSPNLATIKATIESAVSGDTNITQAIGNIASLYGYDDATAAGYVRSALLVVPLLIE